MFLDLGYITRCSVCLWVCLVFGIYFAPSAVAQDDIIFPPAEKTQLRSVQESLHILAEEAIKARKEREREKLMGAMRVLYKLAGYQLYIQSIITQTREDRYLPNLDKEILHEQTAEKRLPYYDGR